MFINLKIFSVAGLLIAVLLFYFLRNRKKMIRKHAHEIWHLEQSVEINSEQIGKRNEALNNYKMLVYNLSEVLLVQPEIPSPDYIRQMP